MPIRLTLRKPAQRAVLIGPADAEVDCIEKGGFVWRFWERGQGIPGNRAEVSRPLDRVVDRAVLPHQRQSALEIAVADVAFDQDPPPEGAVVVRAAAVGENHRQRDLALAEIVAGAFAEFRRTAAVVEGVVDQLEGKAEIGPVGTEGGALGAFTRPDRRSDLGGGGEERGGLRPD